MNSLVSRSQETMKNQFITAPGDVFTIKSHKNCISDSLTILVTNKNTEESFYLSAPNRIEAWKLLLQLDNMGGRSVFLQFGDDEPIPYKQSDAYKYRFAR